MIRIVSNYYFFNPLILENLLQDLSVGCSNSWLRLAMIEDHSTASA